MRVDFTGSVAFTRQGLMFAVPTTGLVAHSSDNALTVVAAGFTFDSGQQQPAARILAAYELHGADLSKHLLGQYSAAIIDSRSNTLVLTQDSFGLGPLFFCEHGAGESRTVTFSSRLGRLPAKQQSLDPYYLADYLINGGAPTARTPFHGIARLTGGTTLVCNYARSRYTRPWMPSDALPRATGSQSQLDERFIALLAESMAFLRDADTRICCEVSGGLDSTSILFMLRKLGIRSHALSIVTRMQDHGDSAAIEFLRKEHPQQDWLMFVLDETPPFSRLPKIVADEPGGEINHSLISAISKTLSSAGIGMILSGLGGDQCLGSDDCSPHHFADDLWQLRFMSLVRSLRKWSRESKARRSWLHLFYYFALRTSMLHALGRRVTPPGLTTMVPSWMDGDFARFVTERKTAGAIETPRHPLPGRNAVWQDIYMLAASEAASPASRLPQQFCYPLLYRPLVEFMLALPPEQRFQAREDRILQRRALTGVLPEPIRLRQTKGSSQPLSDRAFRGSTEWHARLIDSSALVSLGIADRKAWLQAVQRARFGLRDSLAQFYSAVSLDAWLQNLERPVSVANWSDIRDSTLGPATHRSR